MSRVAEVQAYFRWQADQAAQPEERMHGIFAAGGLIGGPVHGSVSDVVCFSEFTFPAIQQQLTTGFVEGRRPPYAPWALVFNKDALLKVTNVRPVLYLSDQEKLHLAEAPIELQDRCVTTVPGDRYNDWSHEREWRSCRGGGAWLGNGPYGVPVTDGLLSAVVVGTQGWTPRELHPVLRSVRAVPRLLWNGSGFVADGMILGAQAGH